MARRDVIDRLLDEHGGSFASELGIRLERGTPAPLFQLLCFSLLASARISTGLAVDAAAALRDAGWTTVSKLDDSSWEDRARVLNEAGYARYDESTARYLADTATWLGDRYGGDPRRLREEADGDVDRMLELLQGAKGIGEVGASIFCREVQAIWPEIRPYADDRVLRTADRLGLGRSAQDLARAAGTDDLSEVTAALVRVETAGDDAIEAVRRAA